MISMPHPAIIISEEDAQFFSSALLSFIGISQSNGDPEKMTSDLVACLKELLNTHLKRGLYKPISLWKKEKWENAALLKLSSTQVLELRHQIWMTYTNLNDWFDAWSLFTLKYATIQGQHKTKQATSQNKTSISSNLMCGSNSAGEVVPLHIIFSSDATNKENYSVNAEWILNLPHVRICFGHDNGVTFPATVAVNA